jgi:hypothetical protein
MSGPRCDAAGCGRWVKRGTAFCAAHAGWQDGEEVERVPSHFQERVRAGEYEGLRAAGVAETLERAAAGPGLRDEIGVVRVALARLLEEEADAGKFAMAVARLVSVAVQAARVERGQASGAGLAADLEAAVQRVVAEGSRCTGEGKE